MKDFFKTLGFRALLIATFPFWPLIVLVALLLDTREELWDAITDYYSDWLEAFRKGDKL